MKYRQFSNDKQRLEDRIRQEEEKHYDLSMKLKIAEALKNDEEILQLQQEIDRVETTLNALYEF